MISYNKHREALYPAILFGVAGLLVGIVEQKWGISRSKVPDTISWSEFFTERVDEVVVTTLIAFCLGYITAYFGLFSDKAEYAICPNCESSFRECDIKNNTCPKCDIDLEPLSGFYKRHPELKNDKRKNS